MEQLELRKLHFHNINGSNEVSGAERHDDRTTTSASGSEFEFSQNRFKFALDQPKSAKVNG